ncbi:MAG: hypothetical protein IT273_01015 [Chitinophagales bacterium]|nr:hypothetical protein [Chitinophagales bacterium]
MITTLFQKTVCPTPYTLDLYCQDLLPRKMAWQVENHLCDCEVCSLYVEEHQTDTDIIDQTDAAFAVRLFLREEQCAPIPEYESMLDMVLMSAATTTVLAPTDGLMIYQQQIQFSWSDEQLSSLWLTIENNQYEILYEGEIRNRATLPLPADGFSNGVYYYKLINGNDLVKVGKFYVYR